MQRHKRGSSIGDDEYTRRPTAKPPSYVVPLMPEEASGTRPQPADDELEVWRTDKSVVAYVPRPSRRSSAHSPTYVEGRHAAARSRARGAASPQTRPRRLRPSRTRATPKPTISPPVPPPLSERRRRPVSVPTRSPGTPPPAVGGTSRSGAGRHRCTRRCPRAPRRRSGPAHVAAPRRDAEALADAVRLAEVPHEHIARRAEPLRCPRRTARRRATRPHTASRFAPRSVHCRGAGIHPLAIVHRVRLLVQVATWRQAVSPRPRRRGSAARSSMALLDESQPEAAVVWAMPRRKRYCCLAPMWSRALRGAFMPLERRGRFGEECPVCRETVQSTMRVYI